MRLSGKNFKFHLISFFCLCASIFFLFKFYFGSSIVFLAQAPNYGDIKLEVLENQTQIEERHFLVNPQHIIYTHKLAPASLDKKLRFYLDRRHKTFASKGLILINKDLSFRWISASELLSKGNQSNIFKSNQTKFTALFEGFGDAAHLQIDPTESRLNNKFLTLFLISAIALLVVLLGQLIVLVIARSDFLNRHKLRLLIIISLPVVFLISNIIIKILFVIAVIYCICHYLFLSRNDSTINYQRLTAVSFLAIIFLFFFAQADLLGRIKNEIDRQENLLEFGFFQQLGNRFTEFLAFKKEIGHLNSLLKVDFFDRSPTTKVIVGKQGTMFEGTGERKIEGEAIASFDNVSDYLGRLPFKDAELKQWQQVISQRHCWLKNQNIKYLFAMAPTKGLVYPELLPEVLIKIKSQDNKKSRIDLLDEYLQQFNDLPVLNLTGPLIAAKHKQSHPKLFYRTDFHWNYLGAYYAYEAIINKLLINNPELNLSPIALDQFEFDINNQWAHTGFLGMLGLMPKWYKDDNYVKLMPNPNSPMQSISPYNTDGVFDIPIPRRIITDKSGQEFLTEYIENPKGQLGKIMVIGDSFIQKSVPLISAHAKQNYFYRAIFEFPYQLIETLKPDIVVQEILNMYLLRQPPINPESVTNAQCN